jgi:type IV secretion system protein VirB9
MSLGRGHRIVTLRTAAMSLLVLAAGGMAHAQATSQPVAGPGDPRIKEFMYDPNAIISVRGALGYEMAIEFAPDERIENVSIGDSLSWQVTPNRKATLLFLKPMSKANPTSMTVVTNRRIYSFLLTAVEPRGGYDPNQILRLRFRYPEPPAPPPAEAAAALPPPKPEDFNFDYSVNGSKSLAPVRVFDDGKVTYFQFNPKKDTPALFVLGSDNKEELAETRISGAYTAVHFVAEKFVLRYGKTKLEVRNNAWKRAPPPVAAPLPQPSGG